MRLHTYLHNVYIHRSLSSTYILIVWATYITPTCVHTMIYIHTLMIYLHMGWLRLVGSLKLWSLLQKSPIKRLYSAKETYNFKEPTNRSHPIPSWCVYIDTSRIHSHTFIIHSHKPPYILRTYSLYDLHSWLHVTRVPMHGETFHVVPSQCVWVQW